MKARSRFLSGLVVVLAAGLSAGLVVVPPQHRPAEPGADTGIELVAANGNSPNQIMTNSLDGKPIITVADFRPGQSRSGQVTVKNAASPAQTVHVWQSALTTGPAGRPNLAGWVRLTVYDATLNRNVYQGAYRDFPALAQPLLICGAPTKKDTCPAWAKNESHVFTFTVTFPDAQPGNGTTLNSYQSTWLRSVFDWASVH